MLFRSVAVSFVDYAAFSAQALLNPRILNYLANSIRVAIEDEDLRAALDAFDLGNIAGFLAEHDALIRDYYQRALIGPVFEVATDIDRLRTELFPKLASAKAILRQADLDGLFAPSVSSALEMLERRAEGARRRLTTSGDPGLIAQAGQELRRNSVLVTAYLGRIKGRLTQWVAKEAERVSADPADRMAVWYVLYDAARRVIDGLTPIFADLWHLIGTLPLPW